MTDRPILFSGPMIRGLLAGRKTQTRRNFVQPFQSGYYEGEVFLDIIKANSRAPKAFRFSAGAVGGGAVLTEVFEPKINKGDRIWVRETWSHTGDHVFSISEARRALTGHPIYQADDNPDYPHAKFWPSIHMPREFSRMTLTVADVRVDRLQDITEADAIAEGVPTNDDYAGSFDKTYCRRCDGSGVHGAFGAGYGVTEVDCSECENARLRYFNLWDHINGAGSSAKNPWIIAYTFAVHRQNIDAMSKEVA